VVKLRLSSINKRSFYGVLGLTALLIVTVNVALLISNASVQASEKVNLASNVDPNAPLACKRIYDIGQWSWKRYGGTRRVDFKSKAFSEGVAELFLEKLDPLKLVFTQSYVAEFKNAGSTAWKKVVLEKNCAYFDNFVKGDYQKLKSEFRLRLATLSAKMTTQKQVFTTSGEVDVMGIKLPKFVAFAKDDSELNSRLSFYISKITSDIDAHLIKAYQNDKKKLITDTFEQIMFSEEPTSTNLIAKSMLGTLDPYSTYFSTEEFDEFYHELAGGTSGIGVKVRKVPRGLLVEKITKESPAARCKQIQPGDMILSVDDVSLLGKSLEEGKRLLKGAENTPIKLVIERIKDSKKVVLNLHRETFTFEEAKISIHQMKSASGDKVAVIEIPSFYGRGGLDPLHEDRSSSEDLRKVLTQVLKEENKPTALVLDLRGNPGGFLEEAVSMAGFFIGDRPVVGVIENNSRRILKDDRAMPLYTGPLVLLQDEGTASASEVLAGALKDHQRAIIVGSKHSFGKGSVQRLFHLNDELAFFGSESESMQGVVKLTTSIFYSPLGHSPANGGVESDIELPESIIQPKDGVDGHRVAKTVPESTPFVEEWELKDMKKKREAMQKKLTLLETKSQERLVEAEPDTKDDAENDDEASEQALREAVAVAADSSEFDLKVHGLSKNTTKN
jgi:carboxyl-terminal processing protease